MKNPGLLLLILIIATIVALALVMFVHKAFDITPNESVIRAETVAYSNNAGNIDRFTLDGRTYLITRGCILEVK